jgi:hypothetical protein
MFADSDTNIGYEHVMVFEKIKEQWYFINPMSTCNLSIHPVNEDVMRKLLSKHEHYIYDKPNQLYRIGTYTLLSCTSMVKLYLGLSNRFIFTPQHLRLYLQGNKITILDKCKRLLETIKYYILIKVGRLK